MIDESEIRPAMNTAQFLATKLAYEIDVLDVAAGLRAGSFVVLDTRKQESWDHGHVPGAVHFPAERLRGEVSNYLPAGTEVVVYGWGPGCNGGTRTAAALVDLGYSVREMIGGFEYWCRSGMVVDSSTGSQRHWPDPFVTADS